MDLHKSVDIFRAWSEKHATTNPLAATNALVCLHAQLLEEARKAENETTNSAEWQQALENIYALITLTPLSNFREELMDHDNLIVRSVASVINVASGFGSIFEPMLNVESDVMASYVSGFTKEQLTERLIELNQTENCAEAYRLWRATNLPGFKIPRSIPMEKYDFQAKGVM